MTQRLSLIALQSMLIRYEERELLGRTAISLASCDLESPHTKDFINSMGIIPAAVCLLL